MSKPNILVLLTDQWRYQSTGFAGNKDVHTPNLDRLANASCHLNQAISSCPVCTPTRASLLTGLRPDKHGLFLNDAPLNPKLPGYGSHLSKLGYKTAWVGKWHVDGNGRSAYIPKERRFGWEYFKGLECSHDYNQSYYYDNDNQEKMQWPGYDAYSQTEDMIEWISGVQKENSDPYAAVLSWGPPHNPYQTAPQKWKDFYKDKLISVPENVPERNVEQAREDLRGYYAHCSALDECVGNILSSIDDLDNTILVFTSDHGDFVGAHGLWDKQGPWDESVRVPLLIHYPNRLNAGVNETCIEIPELFQTLCGMAELPLLEGVDSRDLSGEILNGRTPENNHALFACYHQYGNWPKFKGKTDPLYDCRESRGIRTTRHTYVESLEGPWLLYDNVEDPLQLRNLVGLESHRDVQAELADALQLLLKKYDDSFSPGMDYVREWSYEVDSSGTIPYVW